MAVLGAVAFMLVAGWQFGVSDTEASFSEAEVAMENAIEGSGNEDCKWKQVDCGGWGGGSYEACVVNGNGYQCTCGQVTRECQIIKDYLLFSNPFFQILKVNN